MKSAPKPALRAGVILMGVFSAAHAGSSSFDDDRSTAAGAADATLRIDVASIALGTVTLLRDRLQLRLDPIDTNELMVGASIIADTERITPDFDGGRKIHPRQTRGHG